MHSPLPTLAAYRADLDRHLGLDGLSLHDDAWVSIPHAIESCLIAGDVEVAGSSERLARLLRHSLGKEGSEVGDVSVQELSLVVQELEEPLISSHLFDAVLRVAEEMEGQAAFNLAYTTLGRLRLALPDVGLQRHCLALAMQGRIAREMGDPEGAEEVYAYAMELAEAANDLGSMALMSHGLGGLAFVRGNWPEARQQYDRSLELAQKASDLSMQGRAHRGLLVACAKQGDFEAALQHGWAAYEAASSDHNSRAELLANLGGLCRDCGYHTASFAAYAVGFIFADMDRIRIPAFSGATLAAAWAGETLIARLLATRLEQLLEGGVQPYEEAQALMNLALTYEALGEPLAMDIVSRVEILSSNHKYHELAHLARELQDRLRAGLRQPVATPLALASSALAVVDSLTALARDTDAINVLTGTTGRYTPTGKSHRW